MVSYATPRIWMAGAPLARMLISYLAFCPTLALAGSSSRGLSASSTASRSSWTGAPS
ncbi:hypothetical protein D3C80_1274580 [compost metagenome]